MPASPPPRRRPASPGRRRRGSTSPTSFRSGPTDTRSAPARRSGSRAATPKVRRDARVLRAARGVGRGRAARDVAGRVLRRRPRGRSGPRRRDVGHRARVVDRGPGRVADGARLRGSFGHTLNAPYVWLPLCAIFLLGLLDWRRPWRLVHLDLVVLLAFGVSHVFFNRGEIGLSVPLVYPVLLYLLARLAWIGFRGRGPGLSPSAPIVWLAIAAAFLVGFRIALNLADSGVIDVGYSGVIGADRVIGGGPAVRRGVPRRQLVRRHLRPGQLLRLRSLRARPPVVRRVGRARGRPRGGDLLRPRGRRPAARGRPAAATRPPRPRPRRRAGVRVGRVPVHRLRAAVERQRLARRARFSERSCCCPRRWAAGR